MPSMSRTSAGRLVIVWRITERCNLGCRFCAYDMNLRRSRNASRPEEVLRLGQLIQAHALAEGREVLVSWLGGEPFLWPELARVTEHFRGALGFQVGLTTNGLKL